MILTKDEVVKMARQVWPEVSAGAPMPDGLERFATLCRAPLVAEVERLAAERNAACDNAVTLVFQCNDLETELADWKARALAARKKDIKECAKVCEAPHGYFKDAKTNLECAKAIRALAASPQEQQP